MVGDYAIVPDYPKAENGQLSVSAWVGATTLDPYCDDCPELLDVWFRSEESRSILAWGSDRLDLMVYVINGREAHSLKTTERNYLETRGSTWPSWRTERCYAYIATGSKSATLPALG